jgi:hypothetical protein
MIPEHNYHLLRGAEHTVSRLEHLGLHYGFGGGRDCGNVPCMPRHYQAGDTGGDCSWLAAVLCFKLGQKVSWPGSTYTLATEGREGEGKMFTMHIKNLADPAESHVIVEFKHPTHTRWAECGGRDNPTPGGGPAWFHPTDARIEEFAIKRHFKGF